MIASNINTTATVRNVFIIDDKGIIRVILIYPMNIGRCIPEILRIIEELQVADCENALVPANWVPNDPVIIPPPKTFSELKQREKEIKINKNGMSWYLSFKNMNEKCKKEDVGKK